jgi:exopolysaccharide production protein ExoQ
VRRVSRALWIPIVWFLLSGSRSVSQWLSIGSSSQFTDNVGISTQVLEGNPIDRVVYLSLSILGVMVLAHRKREVSKILQANGPILIFFFYCAVSIIWSDYPDVSFKRWTKALGDLIMVLVVLTDREPYIALNRLFVWMSCLLLPLSILFIKYYPHIGRTYGEWLGEVQYTGVTLGKNNLGAVCLLVGLISLWRLFTVLQDKTDSTRSRRLLALGAIMTMELWLFSKVNSMTALVCFSIAVVLLLIRKFPIAVRKPGTIHLVVAVILCVTISVLFFNVSPGAFRTLGRDSTLTDRTAIWAMLIPMTENYVIGTGYESFWLGPRLLKIWNAYGLRLNQAHSGYLEIFLNLGWVGVSLLAVVLVTGYRRVIAAFRCNGTIGSLMLSCFCVGLIYNFTEAAFFRMLAPVWLFTLMSITGATVISSGGVRLPLNKIADHQNPRFPWPGRTPPQSPRATPLRPVKLADRRG